MKPTGLKAIQLTSSPPKKLRTKLGKGRASVQEHRALVMPGSGGGDHLSVQKKLGAKRNSALGSGLVSDPQLLATDTRPHNSLSRDDEQATLDAVNAGLANTEINLPKDDGSRSPLLSRELTRSVVEPQKINKGKTITVRQDSE